MKKQLADLLRQKFPEIQTPRCLLGVKVKAVLSTQGVIHMMESPAFWVWCLENMGRDEWLN